MAWFKITHLWHHYTTPLSYTITLPSPTIAPTWDVGLQWISYHKRDMTLSKMVKMVKIMAKMVKIMVKMVIIHPFLAFPLVKMIPAFINHPYQWLMVILTWILVSLGNKARLMVIISLKHWLINTVQWITTTHLPSPIMTHHLTSQSPLPHHSIHHSIRSRSKTNTV